MIREGEKIVDLVKDPYLFYYINKPGDITLPKSVQKSLEDDPYKLASVDSRGEISFLGGYLLGFALREKMGTKKLLKGKIKSYQYLCSLRFCQSMELHPDELPQIISPPNMNQRPLIERVQIGDNLQYRIYVGSLGYLSLPSVKKYDLTELSSEELVRRFRTSGNEAYKNAFLERYEPIIESIARGFHISVENMGLQSIVDVGKAGASNGFDYFDLERGVKIESYLPFRVKGTILDFLRSLDNVPRLIKKAAKKIKPFVECLEGRGEKFDPAEYAQICGFSEETLRLGYELLKGNGKHSVSLETPNAETSVKKISLLNILRVEVPVSNDGTEKFELSDSISFLLKSLDPIEQEIIVGYYFDNITLKEIGHRVNLSESRISQMMSDILKRLKPIAERVV